jgi:hypothetical protein
MARPLEAVPRPAGSPPDKDELWKLYDAALREYHLNTTLGVQRQAFYIGLNVTLLGALASFGHRGVLVCYAYLVGMLASLLGAHVVRQTHRHYQAARDHFQAVERRLGLTGDLALSTTPGMVGATGRFRLRVTFAAELVLYSLAAFDLASAVVAVLDVLA